MFGIVYLVTNRTNGKQYVGLTTIGLKARWSAHLSDARNGKQQMLIHRAIRKYGEDAFSITTLEGADSQHALNEAERRWIAELGTLRPNGYNITLGGGGTSGLKWPEEARAKLSALLKGRTFSPETREKMGEAKRGRRQLPEHVVRRAELLRGQKRSPGTCAKIGAIHRGKKLSEEQKEALRLARTGKPLALEARAAISRPVIADGVEYPSLSVAASALGVATETISRRIKSGRPGYQTLGELRTRRKRTPEQIERMRSVASVPVIADGRWFPSATAAAEALGMSRQSIAYRMKLGRQGYGWADQSNGG